MEIIGNRFLARHLRPCIADRQPDVVIAAGVSNASSESAAFDREAKLAYDLVRRCRADSPTVVFFSTPSTGMYFGKDCSGTEHGPVLPGTPYGRHELGLEQAFALAGAPWLVLRQMLSESVRGFRGAKRVWARLARRGDTPLAFASD